MDQKYGCKRTAVKKTQAYRRLQKNQQFRRYKHTWTYLFISGSKSCYNHNRMHSNIQSLHGNWNIASAYQVWLKNCMNSAVMIYWPIILLLLNCMNSAVMIYWPIILLLLNCMHSVVMISWPVILVLLRILNLMAIVTFMLATQTFCMTIYLAVMYPYTRINCKRSGSSEDTRSTNMFIIRLTPYDLTVLAVHQDTSYVPQFPAIYQHTKFGTKIFNCSEDMGQSIMRIWTGDPNPEDRNPNCLHSTWHSTWKRHTSRRPTDDFHHTYIYTRKEALLVL